MSASSLVEDWKSFRLRTTVELEDCELDRLELSFRINSTKLELFCATNIRFWCIINASLTLIGPQLQVGQLGC